MKLIKINESQKKRLFEAYGNGFSFETLSMIGRGQFAGDDNTEAQYSYCYKYLGEPIGTGSSREVFLLNDNFVLKLATGYSGFKQNELEVNFYNSVESELLTKILYYSDDYSFIVSEFAFQAVPEDFEKLIGLPYFSEYRQQTFPKKDIDSKNGGDKTIGFDKYFDNIIPRGTESEISIQDILYRIDRPTEEDKKIIKKNWWLREIRRLVYRYRISDLFINNFGVVNRNGKPIIVILDSGIKRFNKKEFANYLNGIE